MIEKLKNIKLTKKGVYISLAICMLLIGGIGIFTAVKNMNKIIEDTEIDLTQIDNSNDLGINSNIFENLTPDEVINENVADEPSHVTLNFVSPVSGEVKKSHSASELVYSITMEDYRTHNGVDISAEEGSPVISSEKGKITHITDDPLWGTCITVEHDNGFVTCYRNLSDVIPEGIEVGGVVSAGGIIGSVGCTSLVEIGEEPHLHFEMQVDGKHVDPMEYIK